MVVLDDMRGAMPINSIMAGASLGLLCSAAAVDACFVFLRNFNVNACWVSIGIFSNILSFSLVDAYCTTVRKGRQNGVFVSSSSFSSSS